MQTELIDPWIRKLKAGYDAGYYRTEADTALQSKFPWQGKTCGDCPFWLNSVCRVHAEPRTATSHTCSFFDEPHRQTAEEMIELRMRALRKMWWRSLER